VKATVFGLSRWALVSIGVALSLIAWLVLGGDSDEDEIRARIDEVAHAVGSKPDENLAFRALRLKSVFKEGLDSNVRFAAPELRAANGVQELTQLAASAPRFFGEFDVSVGNPEITINEATHEASALSEVTLTGISETVDRDTRRVRFTLRKSDGDWRISQIDVEAKAAE
jgi:hypothetical protein